jgi:hypothetical protein
MSPRAARPCFSDFDEMCLVAVENAGLTREIKPAREIVHEMIDEAKERSSKYLSLARRAYSDNPATRQSGNHRFTGGRLA